MKAAAKCRCEKIVWKGRSGWLLTNGALELIVLSNGGHIASLRRLNPDSPNVLFEAPWNTIEPNKFRESTHAKLYSASPSGPFLSGFTGHATVVGYFGAPSSAEAKLGLPIHGEAASLPWRTISHEATRNASILVQEVREPAMGLRFRRELKMHAGEFVVRVSETLRNERKADTYFQWVEHATFGEPLLSHDDSTVTLPAIKAKTWPLGYEDKPVLADDKLFRWPEAPLRHGGTVDLSRGFIRDHTGFVAAALLDSHRTNGFVAVTNSRLRLAAGYSFPREAFPWVAIWEENRARDYAPWNGITRARGLEFGNAPLPLGLADAVENGNLFDTPTVGCIGAQAAMTLDYQIFAVATPPSWRAVADVRETENGLELVGAGGSERIRLGEK
jgi:hypothetical protein